MRNHAFLAAALFAALVLLPAAPALAQGEVQITQAQANAGNVTPGDAPGFPVTLSRPGSYVFAGNLQPPANKSGIQIASDLVDLDMNGFSLRGTLGAATGISAGTFESVTIRNGTIVGFVHNGIYGEGKNWIVENMRVIANGGFGIYVSGRFASVRSSTVTENGKAGIFCGQRCLVAGSDSSGNGEAGVLITGSGSVVGNVLINNAGLGIQGNVGTGYANNTLAFNNGGGANPQVDGSSSQMQPNACVPACP